MQGLLWLGLAFARVNWYSLAAQMVRIHVERALLQVTGWIMTFISEFILEMLSFANFVPFLIILLVRLSIFTNSVLF